MLTIRSYLAFLLTAGICLSVIFALPQVADAETIPRSEERLQLAEAVREQLPLDEASPEELLAGAMSQFYFFFPAGVATPVTGRAQLDALVATTVLLEEALRRGATSYENAHALFECYAVMYATGRSGAVARSFSAQMESAEGIAMEERQVMEIYLQTLGEFESFGLESARTLGPLLMDVRPERTDVAYTLASIADEQGDSEDAIELYERGMRDERYPERLLALAELESIANTGDAAGSRQLAIHMAPTVEPALADMDERVERRNQIQTLEERVARDRASESEQYELALLYRQVGRIPDALELFGSLSDWSGAPAEFAEEHAIAAMEANLPMLMREVLEVTRDQASPTARLLQLRLASESLDVVRAAMGGTSSLDLDAFLETEEGAALRQDLEAYRALDATGASFVRVYLELITALVEMRRSGEVEEELANNIHRAVIELKEAQPENRSAYRFELMLTLYQRDRDNLMEALEAYTRYCAEYDCEDEALRTSAQILLQTAANEGELDILESVDDLLADWPSGQYQMTYELVRGTAALMRARLGRLSASAESEQLETAREAFHRAVAHQSAPGEEILVSAADYTAIFNNLAVLAIEDRELGVAKLYLEASRRFSPNHSVTLMNLGVALASSRNYIDAFVTFSLGAAEAIVDPAVSFQLMRWAGHIYQLADRPNESLEAYRRALMVYESGTDWTAAVDDGIYPGGPVEWGLLYDEDSGGLVVTLDLAYPPMFFIPAPITVMEMSVQAEP